MILKGIIDEDFINYKKPNMFILFPYCTFKCNKECGEEICQNKSLYDSPNIDVDYDYIVNRYLKNDISKAIVFGGLEPLDSKEDMINLIKCFRDRKCKDNIVIYTGYTEEEVQEMGLIDELKNYNPIIIKYGRYIPIQKEHTDRLLGVKLAGKNQYAKSLKESS